MSALFCKDVAFVQGALKSGGSEAIGHPQAKVLGLGLQSMSEEKGETTERLQNFFANPTEWWDDRQGKGLVQDDDSWHNKSDDGLWLKYCARTTRLGSWPAVCDSARTRPSASAFTRIQGASSQVTAHEGNSQLEVGTCRKLCEDGQITEAVNALDLLVQRGCQVN